MVLVLCCYCEDKIKYGLLQNTLVSKKASICRQKKYQSNNNFLQKIISFSDYMEWKTLIEANFIDNIHTVGKSFSRLLLLKVCESFLLKHSTETWSALWSAGVSFAFLAKRRPNKHCSWEVNLVSCRYLAWCAKVWI